MLQYIIKENESYSVAELAQMAIEGGCRWICLELPSLTDEQIREAVVPDVVDMCRDAGIFLTIDDRPDLARELGLHGIRLSRKYFLDHPDVTPFAVREELGPEAVIGVELIDPTAVENLIPADVDFVTIRNIEGDESRRHFVDIVKRSSNPVPVVAEGEFSIEESLAAITDGCSGVAVGRVISDSPEPNEMMREYIDALEAIS